MLGVTEQLSAITTNEGDMDTGGGVSLLGNQPGAAAAGGGSGTAGDRTLNPFGGSPSSLGGGSSPGPGQFSQSNASLLPNLILNPSAVSNILPTGADLSNRQLLLGNRASELDSSITDRTQPDVIPAQTDVSGANSTQQQQQFGNATGQQLGTGIG
ncbi:MAG: hypothetical protein MJE68_05435, partial [Proteobacteria bacterium]|nr:hypothetical protein [Pseudomonadota bacterium]